MPRNVEIKARVENVPALAERVRAIATSGPHELAQHDIFFNCRQGRLKLRRFADGRGELIAYRRADERGPKTSSYRLVRCSDPDGLGAALSAALGVLGEVRKTRSLWLAGRTRIHIDEVAGLGHFIELEVVLEDGEAAADGEREAGELMAALDIDPTTLVPEAYIDLLLAGGTDRSG